MKPTRSKFFGFLFATVFLIGGVAWIMGEDFWPWVASGKKSVKEKLEALVDRSEYHLEKAKAQVVKVKEKAGTFRRGFIRASKELARAEKLRDAARDELTNITNEIAFIERQATEGKEIKTVSGRVLSSEEVTLRLEGLRKHESLLRTNLKFKENYRVRRAAFVEKLAEMDRRIPLQLLELSLSVEFLERKLEMYREQVALVETEGEMRGMIDDVFEDAQKTLEAAHTDIDGKLSELDLMLSSPERIKVDQLQREPVGEPTARVEGEPLQGI